MRTEIKTTARHLRAGDVMTGSGFYVSHNAWAGVRCPKGHVYVEGNYPNSDHKRFTWNASTTVTVLRATN